MWIEYSRGSLSSNQRRCLVCPRVSDLLAEIGKVQADIPLLSQKRYDVHAVF